MLSTKNAGALAGKNARSENMKPRKMVPVRVLRSTVASGVNLAEGQTAEISPTDFRVLETLGKVELDGEALEADARESEKPEGELAEDSPVEALELGDGPVAGLHEAGLAELGALADFIAAGEDLTKIEGVGKATEKKIVAALEAAGLIEGEA